MLGNPRLLSPLFLNFWVKLNLPFSFCI